MSNEPQATIDEKNRKEDEEAKRQQEREEEMERFLMLQQEQEEMEEEEERRRLEESQRQEEEEELRNEQERDLLDVQRQQMEEEEQHERQVHDEMPNPKKLSLSYPQASFGAAIALMWYALRTRRQWFLALVFLGSSKLAYMILGNAAVAFCVMLFRGITHHFLGGLRLIESESLGDFFRWNVTETCLALTMFRSELDVRSCVLFLFLILAKCLHQMVELRVGHIRMTQEAITIIPNGILQGFPKFEKSTLGVFWMLQTLLILDGIALVHCIQDIVTNGPSVQILFGFEAAILTVTAMSVTLLWWMHVIDGFLQYLHDHSSLQVMGLLHAWKDRKATLTFAIEVQAQGAKFLFYCTFFAIVLTFYGLPINLFREVYMSFQALKSRLLAFAKYRRLMASMNQFESLQSEEELEEAGRTCIICRDDMTIHDSKKLPGCGHVFHKSCLREWLVQQQTCPTCRGDITINASRQNARQRMAERRQQELEQEEDREAENVATIERQQQNERAVVVDEVSQETNSVPHPAHGLTPVAANQDQPPNVERILPVDNQEQPIKSAGNLSLLLPALFRVKSGDAVPIYEVDAGNVLRTVPAGTAVLCTRAEFQSIRENNFGLMLELADGWVRESQVDFLVSIPRAQ